MKRLLRLYWILDGDRVAALALRPEALAKWEARLADGAGVSRALAAALAERDFLFAAESVPDAQRRPAVVRRLLAEMRARLRWDEAFQGLFTRDSALAGALPTPPDKLTLVPESREYRLARALAGGLGTEQRSPVPRRDRMLLHVCCGPDAAGVIGQLKRDFDLECFWYDPNIQPREEHDKRLEAFLKVAELESVPAIVGEYDVDRFVERVRGLEATPEQGAKCSLCYDLRLERAALEAKRRGVDLYATTLAISPHKVQEKLVRFGALNESRGGVPYYHRNFMRDDGFKDSVVYTETHGIYRQDYCGCYYSLHEGGPDARALAGEWSLESTRSPEEFRSAQRSLDARPESERGEAWRAYQAALAGRQARGETDPNRRG